MDTQDQSYQENTQITRSGRKLKYGLLFVDENVPSDQLVNIEVKQMEDGLSLQEIKHKSNRELYEEVFEIMRQAYQSLCQKKDNQKRKMRIMADFGELSNSFDSMDELKSIDEIMSIQEYQNYGKIKQNNLIETIDVFFNKRNRNYLNEFINMLHKTKKWQKLLKIIPQVPRRIVVEEYERELQAAIYNQQIQLKMIKQQQQDGDYVRVQKYTSSVMKSKSRQFQIDLQSSSSSENQSRNNSSSSYSPNRIFSTLNQEIIANNYASERKSSLSEINPLCKQRNKLLEICQKATEQQHQKNSKKQIQKVSFAQEIIEKDEDKKGIRDQKLKKRKQQCNNNGNANERNKCNQSDAMYDEYKITKNNQMIPEKQFGVPIFGGKQQAIEIKNQINLGQGDGEYSEQKYIIFQQAQQTSSRQLLNQEIGFFQSKIQENDAKYIHLIKSNAFNQLNILRPINIANRTSSSSFIEITKNVNMFNTIQLPNLEISGKLQQTCKAIPFVHDIDNESTCKVIRKHHQPSISSLNQQSEQELKIKMQKQQGNSIFSMTAQKSNSKLEKENPFKSLQKAPISQKDLSTERSQFSNKTSPSSSRIGSQLRIGGKVQSQKSRKAFGISQILKQTQREVIEDDIEDVHQN